MFFQKNGGLKNDTKVVADNIKLAEISLISFTKRMRESITNVKGIISQAAEINSQTANQVRQTLGQSRVVSNQVQKVVAQAAKTTGLIGIDTSKNIELFGALNSAMQRNTFFTDEQIVKFQALGFTANLTAQQLAEMATSFDTLGFTTDETLSTMEMMTEEARSYGLNVSQFMDQVNKNLGLMVGYNFKGGVEGLSKMVAQAQSLRIDMAATKGFAEEMLDPSKAIETAAGFQMLGGEIGALGDPFKLLHMAQTDMAGLQDELVKMSAASISFNKETGEFDIPVTQMYRMREAAKLAGRSYEEFSQMAMNAAQRTEKIRLLEQFNTVPEEQKELIASLGKIGANGNLEITMPDGSIKKIGEGFSELVGSDYGELQKMLDVNNMSELDVAKTSMGYLDEIKNSQDTLTNLTRLNLVQSGAFNEFGENIAKSQRNLTQKFLEREGEIKIPESVINTVGTLSTQLQLSDKDAEKLVDYTVTGINTLSNTVDKQLKPLLEQFDIQKLIIDPMKEGWNTVKDIIEGIDFLKIADGKVTIDNAYFDRTNSIYSYPRDNPKFTQKLKEDISQIINGSSNNAVNTITNADNNQRLQSPQNNQTPQFAVNGEINLKIEGLPTNSNISKESLAELLIRNPQAMSIIESQLNNTSSWA